MRTHLYMDEQSIEALNDLPRKMSASKVARWAIKTAALSDKEYAHLLKTDSEFREVQEYLQPRLRRALGLK